jgi:hypothetical protein
MGVYFALCRALLSELIFPWHIGGLTLMAHGAGATVAREAVGPTLRREAAGIGMVAVIVAII